MFKCKTCNNQDKKYIGFNNGKYYCKKCLSFKGKICQSKEFSYGLIKHNINYKLTSEQQAAANKILLYLKKKENVIVSAVCGAGKTEIVFKSIDYYLNLKKRVAFVIPRKDVVIEIHSRLKQVYSNIDVIAVYGGHNQALCAPLTILTTHQLFHYQNYFDLVILDEADAFPYANNVLLETFLFKSLKGQLIIMSATMNNTFYKYCKNVIYVNKRFHKQPLVIPKIVRTYFLFNHFYLLYYIKYFINKQKKLLIFVPTIKDGLKLQKLTNYPLYLFP